MKIPLYTSLLIMLFVAAISAPLRADQTYLGEIRQVGQGTMATWTTVNQDGAPTAIGVTLTTGVLDGLPTQQPDYEYVLALPTQAARTPFTHFALDWNPHGHDPVAVYGVPHFDFHFYIISSQERAAITATGADLARVERIPAPAFVPHGYVATPGGVPHMGAHWVDPAAPEFHGQPFAETFIYGFYNGRMAFIEPMLTLAYLRTNPQVDRAIALPEAYPVSGYYPTRFTIQSDPQHGEYTVALRGLTWRAAPVAGRG